MAASKHPSTVHQTAADYDVKVNSASCAQQHPLISAHAGCHVTRVTSRTVTPASFCFTWSGASRLVQLQTVTLPHVEYVQLRHISNCLCSRRTLLLVLMRRGMMRPGLAVDELAGLLVASLPPKAHWVTLYLHQHSLQQTVLFVSATSALSP